MKNDPLKTLLEVSNGDIDYFVELMTELQKNAISVQEADKGEQISKGKNPIERSNDEKEAMAEPVQPLAAPGEVPGANVAIGNKDLEDADDITDLPTKVKLSNKKDVINTKPKTMMNKGEFASIDAAR